MSQELTQLKAGGDDDPRSLQKVAQEFESLLVAHLLKTARESSEGGWLGDEGESGSALTEMAEQQLAKAISAQGGLGLADLVTRGLAPNPTEMTPGTKS
jgi:flagellar protein FlgJ